MSPSGKKKLGKKKKIRLEVKTQDPASEVIVADGNFRPLERGIGNLEILLSPGVYKVKVRAGDAEREEHVVLREGAETVEKTFGPVNFSSPIPLWNTAKSHEFHQKSAKTHTDRVVAKAGSGSSVFLYAREWTAPARPKDVTPPFEHPAKGIKLKDLQGNTIVNFEEESESELEWDPWAAGTVELDPGAYRLSLETPSVGALDQILIASPGWQTQVFLLQRDYGDGERRADLANASMRLSQARRFEPGDKNARLLEVARLALSGGREVLSSEMRQMLRKKFANPMLGLFAGHLLLLEEEPDLSLLATVVRNLRGLLGQPHPDVEALALKVDGEASNYVFDVPPLLRRSWDIVMETSARRPELAPDEALSSRVADRIWGNTAWLIWQSESGAGGAHDLELGATSAAEAEEDDYLVSALRGQLHHLVGEGSEKRVRTEVASVASEAEETATAAKPAMPSMIPSMKDSRGEPFDDRHESIYLPDEPMERENATNASYAGTEDEEWRDSGSPLPEPTEVAPIVIEETGRSGRGDDRHAGEYVYPEGVPDEPDRVGLDAYMSAAQIVHMVKVLGLPRSRIESMITRLVRDKKL